MGLGAAAMRKDHMRYRRDNTPQDVKFRANVRALDSSFLSVDNPLRKFAQRGSEGVEFWWVADEPYLRYSFQG